MFIQSYNFLNRTGCKKDWGWKKVVAIKFLADKWREKSSCLAAPCVAINLHLRLCLVLALALSDSFMCCTMYHTYLVSNSLVFLSFGNGFNFFFRNKHVQVWHFFSKMFTFIQIFFNYLSFYFCTFANRF